MPKKSATSPSPKTSWRIVAVLFVVLIASIVLLLRNQGIRIQQVSVDGTQILSRDDIVSLVEESIAGSFAYIIPKNSAPLVRAGYLEAKLKGAFPEIENVRIEKRGASRLDIELTEYNPWNIWCAHEPDDFSVVLEGCYFMDETGLVFSRAPYFSDRVFVKFFSLEEQTIEDPIGSVVVPPNVLAYIVNVLDVIRSEGVGARRVSVLEDGDFTILIDSLEGQTTQREAKLLCTTDGNPEDIQRRIDVALATPAFIDEFLDNPEELNYIDLRFPDKIFYRFGFDEVEEVSTAEPEDELGERNEEANTTSEERILGESATDEA